MFGRLLNYLHELRRQSQAIWGLEKVVEENSKRRPLYEDMEAHSIVLEILSIPKRNQMMHLINFKS